MLVQSLAGSYGKSTAGSERCRPSELLAQGVLGVAAPHCFLFGPALSMAGQIEDWSCPPRARQLVEA